MRHLNVTTKQKYYGTPHSGIIGSGYIGLRDRIINAFGIDSSHVASLKDAGNVVIYGYDDRLDDRLRLFCATNAKFSLISKCSTHVISYSLDNENWRDIEINKTYIFEKGTILYLRGKLTGNASSTNYTHFKIENGDEECIVLGYGNISYLMNYDDLSAPIKEYACYHMFEGCDALLTPPQIHDVYTLNKSCFEGMFMNCVNLRYCPDLFADVLAENCYKDMFKGCTTIGQTPIFQAEILADGCYESMFENCTNLEIVHKLKHNENKQRCCYSMFKGCTSLADLTLALNENDTTILPATTLAPSCYELMFCGCTALTTLPQLPAKKSQPSCYAGMFLGCIELRNNSADGYILNLNDFNTEKCCKRMFALCETLQYSPVLIASSISGTNCLEEMFLGCASLEYITSFANYGMALPNCLGNWTKDVPISGGTFKCTGKLNVSLFIDMNKWRRNTKSVFNGIPENWIYDRIEYESEYLCISSANTNESISVSFNFNNITIGDTLHVSLTYGLSWITIHNGDTIEIPAGKILCIHNTSNSLSISETKFVQFVINGDAKIFGNIHALLNNNEFTPYCLTHLFKSDYTLDASDLDIGDRPLAVGCCSYMFAECPKLISAPGLPSKVEIDGGEYLPTRCYSHMFDGCEKLTFGNDYELPADKLGECCYEYMFSNCTSITNAPKICAVAIESGSMGSCAHMFDGCTNLTHLNGSGSDRNKLCITSLGPKTYAYMFYNCKSMNTIPMIMATTAGAYCCSHMFDGSGVDALEGDLNMTLRESCFTYMFANCVSLKKIETEFLYIESLADRCYSHMFENCISLGVEYEMSEFVLPATVMSAGCYSYMFSGCSNIIYGPSLARVRTLDEECFSHMFENCTKLAQPIKLPDNENISLYEGCYKYMFKGCKLLNIIDEIHIGTPNDMGECAHMFEDCVSISDASYVKLSNTVTDECYSYMFFGCTSLTSTPELHATTLADHCYEHMFHNCVSLDTIPNLPATELKEYCYSYMFANCKNLKRGIGENDKCTINIFSTDTRSCEYMFFNCSLITNCVELKFTEHINQQGHLGSEGFYRMFDGCSKLTKCIYNDVILIENCYSIDPYCFAYMFYNSGIKNSPNIKTNTLSVGCCLNMFAKCKNLVTIPKIGSGSTYSQINILPNECYKFMFSDCENLVSVAMQISPTMSMGVSSCESMFSGCRSLQNAPILGEYTRLDNVTNVGCYRKIFEGCKSLSRVKIYYNRLTTICIDNWLHNAHSTGFIYCNSNLYRFFNNGGPLVKPFGWKASISNGGFSSDIPRV